MIAEVNAKLFAGGPLSDANVTWTVTPVSAKQKIYYVHDMNGYVNMISYT